MAIGRAVGYPDYTYAGDSKYIPILFAGKTLEKLYSATFLSEVSNIDYVGEVRNVGDKVHIRTVPDITIRDYVKNQSLTLEHPESTAIEFTIDYAKYFNLALDDIDIKQFDLNMMDKWSSDAAMQLKITIETAVLAAIYSQVHASNAGSTAGAVSSSINLGVTGTPLQLTKTNILDVLVDCGQVLDEQNVPETERWIVLPAWAIAMIKKSDLKDASLTGDQSSPLRNGRVGMIDRLTIYNSNLLATSSDGGNTVYNCVFGHKMALAFVSQLSKVEKYRPENGFADAIKGLTVYGFKVIQSVAMGHLYIYK